VHPGEPAFAKTKHRIALTRLRPISVIIHPSCKNCKGGLYLASRMPTPPPANKEKGQTRASWIRSRYEARCEVERPIRVFVAAAKRSKMRPICIAGLMLALAISGCRFGEASFQGEVEDTPFDPGGTVFAYVDAFDDNFVEYTTPRVVVFMSWLTFDPERDLRDRSGSELENLRHELGLRDAMSLVFRDPDAMEMNADFSSEMVDGLL
jgi:hypothetical protein